MPSFDNKSNLFSYSYNRQETDLGNSSRNLPHVIASLFRMPERSSIVQKFGTGRRKNAPTISQSMQLPARFNSGDNDDANDEDVCVAGKNTPFNMNQSFYQVLTAATSNIRMSSRFDDDSDDSDDDPTTPKAIDKKLRSKIPGLPLGPKRELTKDVIQEETDDEEDDPVPAELAGAALQMAIPTNSLQAQTQLNPPTFAVNMQDQENETYHDFEENVTAKSSGNGDLEEKLMDIFNLPATEKVISGMLLPMICQ